MNRNLCTLAVAPFLCLLLAGCHISEHKNGNRDNVDIGTPFGSMQVKTSDSADASAIGLAAYPGAIPVNDKGDDSNSADINMSFGNFHLGVKAAGFQTSDSQDKVIAFYRKDLAARYGDVIECRANKSIGSPTRTSQGLTCDDKDDHRKVKVEDSDNIELRAGSEQHQHIVGIKPHDGGTKIGLVALDLPSHLSIHDDKDSE
ncbi:MAG TPA: hypothetical protein VIJ38_18790 [Acidobacteriaceae bacterium]